MAFVVRVGPKKSEMVVAKKDSLKQCDYLMVLGTVENLELLF